MTMNRTQISAMLTDIAVAISEGQSNDLDFALSRVTQLRRHFAPPSPTRAQQDAVLCAMREGHHSAEAIKAATGLPKSIVYASRYLLWDRGLVHQHHNGASSPRWSADPL